MVLNVCRNRSWSAWRNGICVCRLSLCAYLKPIVICACVGVSFRLEIAAVRHMSVLCYLQSVDMEHVPSVPLFGEVQDISFLTCHGKSRFPGLFIWLKSGERVPVKVPQGVLLTCPM